MSDSGEQQFDEVIVVYAVPDAQYLITLEFEPGMTARDAVDRSGLAKRFPEIADAPLALGVFGRPIAPEQIIEPGMRIEICRPLQRDPRELRRIMTSLGMVVGQREKD